MKLLSLLSIAFVFGTYPAQAFGVFQQIWKGYQSSLHKEIQKVEQKQQSLDFAVKENIYNWNLSLGTSFRDDSLVSLLVSNPKRTLAQTNSLKLSKSSYSFGTFSFEHQQTSYDLSYWSSSSANRYEARNIFSYNYEFFNDTKKIDYDLVEANYNAEKTTLELQELSDSLDFFNAYMSAKSDVYLVQITQDFVKRAKKRVAKIKRRQRDGVSRSVDFLQAKSALLSQKSRLENARSSLKKNLAVLEDILGFKINDRYFEKISWPEYSFDYWAKKIKPIDYKENLSFKNLKAQLAKSDLALDKVDKQNSMKLSLGLAYTANAIKEGQSQAFSDSQKGLNDSKSVSLNLIIPLGPTKNDSLRRQLVYKKKRNELELQKLKSELKIKKETLVSQINYAEKVYSFSKEKVKLNQKMVQEQNKLYLRGQTGFEQVLRAEESYLDAKLSAKKSLATKDSLIANYAFLQNKLLVFLNHYQD